MEMIAESKFSKKVSSFSSQEIGFIFLIAFIAITICSKSSPLYPLNDWVDSNIYMSLGKGMLSGKTLYHDLYDQKGPFIFAVHAIASLVSRTSFVGVWIIEIITAFFFIYYSAKSISLFYEKESIFWSSILALLTYTSTSFSHGDSAEELALPFLAYAIWVGLNSLKYKEYPSVLQLITIGITSGCIFWMKYTLVSLYIGWFVALVVLLPKTNKARKALLMVIEIGAGVIISTIPWIIYFGLNDAIDDLLKSYFYNNIFYYPRERVLNPVLHFIVNLGVDIKSLFQNSPMATIFTAIGFIILMIKKEWRYLFFWGACFISCFAFIYAGTVRHVYSSLVISVFFVLGFISINELLNKQIHGLISNLYGWKTVIVILVMIFACLLLSPNVYMLKYDKEDFPQYKFKEIIEQTPNAKILMYRTMDTGVYTVCDLIPQYQYYFYPNLHNQEIDDSQDAYINDGTCDYVVVRIPDYEENLADYEVTLAKLDNAGYTEISRASYFFEGSIVTDLLFAFD